ncbi:MAG: hypothetical protein ACUVX1_14820 [Chloroflexota bacterium]
MPPRQWLAGRRLGGGILEAGRDAGVFASGGCFSLSQPVDYRRDVGLLMRLQRPTRTPLRISAGLADTIILNI